MWKGTVTEKGPEMWTPAHFSARPRAAEGERPGVPRVARPGLGVLGSDWLLLPSPSGPSGGTAAAGGSPGTWPGAAGQVSKLSRRCGGCFAGHGALSRGSSGGGGDCQSLAVAPVPGSTQPGGTAGAGGPQRCPVPRPAPSQSRPAPSRSPPSPSSPLCPLPVSSIPIPVPSTALPVPSIPIPVSSSALPVPSIPIPVSSTALPVPSQSPPSPPSPLHPPPSPLHPPRSPLHPPSQSPPSPIPVPSYYQGWS